MGWATGATLAPWMHRKELGPCAARPRAPEIRQDGKCQEPSKPENVLEVPA
ncbi:hypothetical protein HispidOSU_000620 [Sigmodon hispidus]